MKYLMALFVALFAFGVSFAGAVSCGGNIPVINNITSVGVVYLNPADSEKQTIAALMINSNAPEFIVHIYFAHGGKFHNADNNSYIEPIDLRITESGTGRLGDGIVHLIDRDLLPLANNEFVWDQKQNTSTINYGMIIFGIWNVKNALAGLYQETIITSIEARF
ncbi:MAG: hypothetical protein PHO56_00475 [Patescibacteria group bacterium]|nr:hypothetical protein [Patescibacteria group bacterium]